MLTMLWQQIPNTTITEILCSTEMNAIVLDCEHGYFNNETLVDCIRVVKLYNKKAFVRMKYNERLIQLCYDNCIDGLIYANVESKTHINPGVGLVKNNFWGQKDIKLKTIYHIAQTESCEAIDNIDELGYFDYYMIGMYDLSKSCGAPGNFCTSKFKHYMNQFDRSINSNSKAIHLVKDIDKNIDKYKDYGCIAFSLDTLAIIDKVKELNKYV